MKATEEQARAEQIILDYTASSKWEQIKMMNWTTAEMMDVFAKHLTNSLNPLDAKIDSEGNVLSEPKKEDFEIPIGTQCSGWQYINKVVNGDKTDRYYDAIFFNKTLQKYQQAQTITERLKSDKEKIENLREGVKTNSLLLDRNIELSEDITQLKAKAERDLKTANKNDLFYTNEIIRIERNSVSTEYLEETVLHYKEQIIKLKQEVEALKNER